jgi:4-azaleucine resistance transporter AzlC
MCYGLSFLEKYRHIGPRKWYLMFALTDETYALLNVVRPPSGVTERDFMLAVSFLNHLYWIAGSVIGVTAGALIKIDMTGIDFIMTALFVVLAMDQWKAYPSHEPVLIGFVSSVATLLLFGPEKFMVPALIVIIGLLILRRKAIMAKRAAADGMEHGS